MKLFTKRINDYSAVPDTMGALLKLRYHAENNAVLKNKESKHIITNMFTYKKKYGKEDVECD